MFSNNILNFFSVEENNDLRPKSLCSPKDNFFVNYFGNFIDFKNASKYYDLFETFLSYNSPEESKVLIRGKYIEIPRKQVAYGDDGTFYKFAGCKVFARSWNNDDPISKALKEIKSKVELVSGFKFNFVLINRYNDGDDYIGFHSDDEKDLVHNSHIVGVSLGAQRDFVFCPKNFIPQELSERPSLLLENGSLVIMQFPTNKYWKHSVPKRSTIKNPRISLTFRLINN